MTSGQDHFPGRRQLKAYQMLITGTLAGRVKTANLLKLVAEERQTYRLFKHRRKKIHQVTTHGKAAAILNQSNPLITERSQPVQKDIARNLVADLELQAQGIENLAGQDLLLQSFDRCDYGLAAIVGESGESR